MRSRIFIFIALLAFLTTSCAQVSVKDTASLEESLKARINEFQSALVKKDALHAWNMSMMGRENKDRIIDNYISSFNEGGHMASNYSLEYIIKNFEIRNQKARVEIKYLVQEREGDKKNEATMYNFWTFENGEWYFLYGGKDSFYKLHNWWTQ